MAAVGTQSLSTSSRVASSENVVIPVLRGHNDLISIQIVNSIPQTFDDEKLKSDSGHRKVKRVVRSLARETRNAVSPSRELIQDVRVCIQDKKLITGIIRVTIEES